MAGSVNKVILVGNLGRDPEVRTAQDGSKIVSLNVATSESWKDRSTGERKEKTEWHKVVVFNPHLAEIAEQYLRKGSSVYLEGQLRTRKWTDNQGNDRYTTEVVLAKFKGELTLLDKRGNGGPPPAGGEDDYGHQRSGSTSGGGGGGSGWEPPPDLDDEIPF